MSWRSRRASRAVGLARQVELRIDKDHVARQRVAIKAGFTLAGTGVSHVPAAGATYEDLRYALSRQVVTVQRRRGTVCSRLTLAENAPEDRLTACNGIWDRQDRSLQLRMHFEKCRGARLRLERVNERTA